MPSKCSGIFDFFTVVYIYPLQDGLTSGNTIITVLQLDPDYSRVWIPISRRAFNKCLYPVFSAFLQGMVMIHYDYQCQTS